MTWTLFLWSKSLSLCLYFSLSLSRPLLLSHLLAVSLLVDPASVCSSRGDGSSGCSLSVHWRPDSPHLAAAAGWGCQGDTPEPKWKPAWPGSLPLALPHQTRHQPQDHPIVSHTKYVFTLAVGFWVCLLRLESNGLRQTVERVINRLKILSDKQFICCVIVHLLCVSLCLLIISLWLKYLYVKENTTFWWQLKI